MRKVRIRVDAKLDGSRVEVGTVTIDRDKLLFSVRPLRRRREFTLPLPKVAEMVIHSVIKTEVADRRAEKKLAGSRHRRTR